MQAPCHQCNERANNCHSTCNSYKKYKKELQTEKDYITSKKRSSYKTLGDFPVSYTHFNSSYKKHKRYQSTV